MKKIILSLLLILTNSCVATNQPDIITPSSSVSFSPVPSQSILPVPSQMPPSPSPFPVSTPTPVTEQTHEVTIGLGEAYKGIINGYYRNLHDDLKRESEYILRANPESVIIELRQEIVDTNRNGTIDKEEEDNWEIYDEIFKYLQTNGKNIKVIFKLKSDVFPDTTPLLKTSDYISFIYNTARKYRDKNIAWTIEDNINNRNSLTVSREEYINVLKLAYQRLKSVSPDNKLYMGSITQSEIFGNKISYSVDNFLGYLNLGAADYCDGFIFEIYALSTEAARNQNHGTKFNGKDYTIIGEYHKLIDNVLKQKNISNKELILLSGTYGGENIGGNFQSEEAQSKFIFSSFVYALHLGFGQVYASKLYDDTNLSTENFFAKTGLLKDLSDRTQYKAAFWTLNFLSDLLNDSVYSSEIKNLPNGVKGYTFNKTSSTVYILWSDIGVINEGIRLPLNVPKITVYNPPLEADEIMSKIEYILPNEGYYDVSLKTGALRPVVFEVIRQ